MAEHVCRRVARVELSGGVHAHDLPGQLERFEQTGRADAADGCLDRLGVCTVRPDEQVTVLAEAIEVVDSAERHAI